MSERAKAKSYTAEFKDSAVKFAVESGRPMAQTARELGVSTDTFTGGFGSTTARSSQARSLRNRNIGMRR